MAGSFENDPVRTGIIYWNWYVINGKKFIRREIFHTVYWNSKANYKCMKE